ncbi:MAG: RNA polymerase sigma factor [Verrucomicrobiaceae bacterium]
MHSSHKKDPQADEVRTRATLLGRLGSESDNDAWLRFYEMYKGVILGMARKLGLSEATSWDVLQEVMLAVNRVSKSFSYDRENGVFIANAAEAGTEPSKARGGFRQWLFTVIKRAIWKHRYNPKRKREVLFSDMVGHDGDKDRDFIDKLSFDAEAPDAALEKKSEDDYSMALFEQAICLLPECTKKAHPRKIAIFLALKQPHVFATIVEATSPPLPPPHMAEMKALNSLPRDASGLITKAVILKHYNILSNHLDQEVKAVKTKLAAIYTDLRSGRDPRES